MPLPDRDHAVALGRALRRVRDSIQKQDPSGRSATVWFQGPEPYLDVVVELAGGAVAWFQVTLRGRSLTWDAGKGRLATGRTGELEVDGPLPPASKPLAIDSEIDRAVVQAVAWLLAARAGEEPFDSASAVLAGWLEGR